MSDSTSTLVGDNDPSEVGIFGEWRLAELETIRAAWSTSDVSASTSHRIDLGLKLISKVIKRHRLEDQTEGSRIIKNVMKVRRSIKTLIESGSDQNAEMQTNRAKLQDLLKDLYLWMPIDLANKERQGSVEYPFEPDVYFSHLSKDEGICFESISLQLWALAHNRDVPW